MKRNHTGLRILIPVLHYPPVVGGFEVFLENIAERVSRENDVRVLTGRVAGAHTREHSGRLSVYRTASLWPLRDLSYSSTLYILTLLPVLFVLTLWHILRFRPSLLHANGFFNGIICLCASVLTGVPYVVTIQSADFTIYHPRAALNFVTRAQAFVERLIFARARVCHAVSNDLCKHFKKRGSTHCVMIPNGVEMDFFRPVSSKEREQVRERYRIPGDAEVIVNVSRLEHKNGVHDVIDAAALLHKENEHIFLVVIGDGSKRAELEEQARARGILDRMMFTGVLPRSEVGELVASSDIFVRTPHAEGFGIVFLEAMAAGVPVVATPVGGIVDFLEDEETGLFAKVGDAESIKDAFSRLLGGKELRERLIKNSSRVVREQYDWDRITERLVREVYQPAVHK